MATIFKCNFCEKVLSTKYNLILHSQRVHERCKTTSCVFCGKGFYDKKDAMQHLIVHVEEKPYECNICKKCFSSSGTRKMHVLTHTRERQHICKICKTSFTASKNLQLHQVEKHPSVFKDLVPVKNMRKTCTVCFKEVRYNSLNSHMRSHAKKERIHQCPICDARFTQSGALSIHIRIHTKDVSYKCNVCGKSFTQKVSLQIHLSRVHEKRKDFECVFCGFLTSSKDGEHDHLMRHIKEKPHTCSKCGASFCKTGGLTAHFRIHTGDFLHRCHLCGKGFNQSENFKRHVRTHSIVREKPHKCSVCNARFTEKTYLKSHVKNMHGPRKFLKCNQCEKSFKKAYALKCHRERIHEGTKRTKSCIICSKSFHLNQELFNHLRTHTMEMPYFCQFCDACFSQTENRNRHEQRYHGQLSRLIAGRKLQS